MSFELIMTEYMDVYKQSIDTQGITGAMVLSDTDCQIPCTHPTTPGQSQLAQFTEHSDLLRNKTVLAIGYLGNLTDVTPGNEIEVNSVRYSILTPPSTAKIFDTYHSVVLVAK